MPMSLSGVPVRAKLRQNIGIPAFYHKRLCKHPGFTIMGAAFWRDPGREGRTTRVSMQAAKLFLML